MRSSTEDVDLRPLGERLRSAENYYGSTDVEDGLGQSGGLGTGPADTTAPVEEEMEGVEPAGSAAEGSAERQKKD